MKMLVWGILTLALGSVARADILFLDVNFSINELKVAADAARTRGEKLHVFPRRTPEQERTMDVQWRLTQNLQQKMLACLQLGKGGCEKLSADHEAASKKMKLLAAGITPLGAAELKKIFAEVVARGLPVSTIVISGHSGGFDYSGLFGSFNVDDVKSAVAENPAVLPPVRAVLLWGCYSGTLNALYNRWKKNFPSVQVFAGYETRSPLGIRETGARFLRSFLAAEPRLRVARTVGEAHRIFRAVDLVADLDGTALVGDFYLTYEEADSVANMLARCRQFPVPLMEKYRCYAQGEAGCEHPPADHLGPLRDFYTFLQVNRHCADLVKDKYPDMPTPESLIRLIYLDNVKENFARQHGAEFPAYNRLNAAVGLPAGLNAESFIGSTHRRDLDLMNLQLSLLSGRGLRDGTIVDDPRYEAVVRVITVSQSLYMLVQALPMNGGNEPCVPFSWVERGAAEPDKCNFSLLLQEPWPAVLLPSINAIGENWRLIRHTLRVNPLLLNTDLPAVVPGFRDYSVKSLEEGLKKLRSYPDRTANENELIVKYEGWLTELAAFDDAAAADRWVRDARLVIAHLEARAAELTAAPDMEMSIRNLNLQRDSYLARVRALGRPNVQRVARLR